MLYGIKDIIELLYWRKYKENQLDLWYNLNYERWNRYYIMSGNTDYTQPL